MEDVDFFQSQLRNRVLQGHDATRDIASRPTRLLEKRKEMTEVQAALDVQRDEFAIHEEGTKKREDDIKRKNRDLQESLIKFNRFLQDNDSKREEAETKYSESRVFGLQKDQEIIILRAELAKMKKEEEDKRDLLEKHKRYQRYLHSVIEGSEEFKEVKFLIERWKTLYYNSIQLREKIDESLLEVEEGKVALQKYTEEKSDQKLDYNNQISELRNQLEIAENRALQGVNSFDERAGSIRSKTTDFGQIKMACENIHRHLLEYSKQKYKKLDTVQQVTLMGDYLRDFIDVSTYNVRTTYNEKT